MALAVLAATVLRCGAIFTIASWVLSWASDQASYTRFPTTGQSATAGFGPGTCSSPWLSFALTDLAECSSASVN